MMTRIGFTSPGVRGLAAMAGAACLSGGGWFGPAAGQGPESVGPLVDGIVVVGVGGEEDYAARFARTADAWSGIAARAGRSFVVLGPEPESGGDRAIKDRLQELLARQARTGGADADASPPTLWIVLVGHGSYDGREAKFNLPGPDITPDELKRWVDGLGRPLVMVAGGASSAPFLSAVSGQDRVVVTATKDPSEQSFAYFGEHFVEAIGSGEADLDQDGATSVLEAFLKASQAVKEFFEGEGRIASEEAMLDDNGDGRGTLAVQFRGVSPVPAEANVLPEGALANQISLIPNPLERNWPPGEIAERDRLERELLRLRMNRDKTESSAYLESIESVLVELAELYERMEPITAGSGTGQDAPAPDDAPPETEGAAGPPGPAEGTG